MFKNFIIIILIFCLCSLLFQNKENVNILVKDLADAKELVDNGTDYVKKTFNAEFSDVIVEATEDDPFSLERDKEIENKLISDAIENNVSSFDDLRRKDSIEESN